MQVTAPEPYLAAHMRAIVILQDQYEVIMNAWQQDLLAVMEGMDLGPIAAAEKLIAGLKITGLKVIGTCDFIRAAAVELLCADQAKECA